MSRERVVSVSHWKDLDGVASASIVYRRYGECLLYWSEPQNLNLTLKKLLSLDKISKIIISDLGLNATIIDEVVEVLDKLRERSEIYWYDHHYWREEFYKRVSEIITRLVVDRSKCSASIVWAELNPKDEVSRKLAYLACDSDFWIREDPLTVKLEKVVASNMDRSVIVKKLASGNFWDSEFERVYLKRVKLEKRLISKALSRVKEYTGPTGLRIAVVTGDYPSSLIGSELAKRGYDIIAIVSPRGGVSLRRGNPKVNLLLIAEKLGGGGHPFAAGGTLRYNFIDKLLARIGYYRKIDLLLNSIFEGLRRE